MTDDLVDSGKYYVVGASQVVADKIDTSSLGVVHALGSNIFFLDLRADVVWQL